jgi:chorismate-pyruvate lyase
MTRKWYTVQFQMTLPDHIDEEDIPRDPETFFREVILGGNYSVHGVTVEPLSQN